MASAQKAAKAEAEALAAKAKAEKAMAAAEEMRLNAAEREVVLEKKARAAEQELGEARVAAERKMLEQVGIWFVCLTWSVFCMLKYL